MCTPWRNLILMTRMLSFFYFFSQQWFILCLKRFSWYMDTFKYPSNFSTYFSQHIYFIYSLIYIYTRPSLEQYSLVQNTAQTNHPYQVANNANKKKSWEDCGTSRVIAASCMCKAYQFGKPPKPHYTAWLLMPMHLPWVYYTLSVVYLLLQGAKVFIK